MQFLNTIIHTLCTSSGMHPSTLRGLPPALVPDSPALHGHPITLCSHDPDVKSQPPNLFKLHCTQCVVASFATTEY
jgi:hypothetical protein